MPKKNAESFYTAFIKGKYVAHFTQLAWANTEKIGCGLIWYKGTWKDSSKEYFVQKLVCNYYPMGNRMGRSMMEDY